MLSRPFLVIALILTGLAVNLNGSHAWDVGYDIVFKDPVLDEYANNGSTEVVLAKIPMFSSSNSDDRKEIIINKSNNSIYKRNISLLDLKEKVSSKVELEHPSLRRKAAIIIADIPGDLTIDQICAIYNYIKFGNETINGWNYISEPIWMDVTTYANETLELGESTEHSGVGDCDDFAILMASLIEAIGGTSKIVLAYGNGAGHAFTEVYIGKLDENAYDIITIDQWLKQNYKTDLITLRLDENTYEIWLNLDWGEDENGVVHPGGPYVPLPHYLAINIPENGPKNSVSPPESYINSIDWNKKGISFQIAGKYDDAIRCYDEAIKLDPKCCAPWNNKGVAFISQNKYSQALYCFNMSINLNPIQATALYNKGIVLYLQHRLYDSMKCFEKALDLNPNYPQAWNNKGLTLVDWSGVSGRPLDNYNDASKQCFERALGLNSSLPEAWNNIGVANYQNVDPYIASLNGKSLPDCIRFFDKAIGMRFAPALNNKARLYDFWQKDDEALNLYNEALRLDQNNNIIVKNKGDLDWSRSGQHLRNGYIGFIVTPSPPMLILS